jgi:drug/metabolite transporter (DMT)-like permease
MENSVSDQPPQWKIGLILTAGVLSASTAAIFVRLALEAVEVSSVGFSLVLAASRLTLAALFLLPAWRSFRTAQFQPNALGYSMAAGCCLAVHFASWVTSLSYTSVAASTALVTTNPVWVAILSWLWFGEKPSLGTSFGIAIALMGSLLIGLGSGGSSVHNSLLGNLLAVAGSVAVSLYFLLGREAQRRGLGISSHIVLTYTTAALVLLPLPLLFGVGYAGYPSQVYLWIALMAVFPQLIGHTSFNWAVRWISPTLVTLTILAEPVGSGILALLFFQENPGVQVIFGAVVILVGVAIAALGATPTSKATSNN